MENPLNLLPAALNNGARAFIVDSDNMAPTFSYGDRLLIDANVTTPDKCGVYLIDDNGTARVFRVQCLIGSDRVRLSQDNPHNSAFELTRSDLLVLGRVEWLARPMDKIAF